MMHLQVAYMLMPHSYLEGETFATLKFDVRPANALIARTALGLEGLHLE